MERKVSEYIADFLEFIRNAQAEYGWGAEKEKEQETLTQDILHCLELEENGYHEKARLAGCLAETRRERRQHKDAVEELMPVVEFAEKNKKLLNEMEQMAGAVRKSERHHANRSCHPRVLKKGTEGVEADEKR